MRTLILCHGRELYFNTATIRRVSLALLSSLFLKLVDCCVKDKGFILIPTDIPVL